MQIAREGGYAPGLFAKGVPRGGRGVRRDVIGVESNVDREDKVVDSYSETKSFFETAT